MIETLTGEKAESVFGSELFEEHQQFLKDWQEGKFNLGHDGGELEARIVDEENQEYGYFSALDYIHDEPNPHERKNDSDDYLTELTTRNKKQWTRREYIEREKKLRRKANEGFKQRKSYHPPNNRRLKRDRVSNNRSPRYPINDFERDTTTRDRTIPQSRVKRVDVVGNDAFWENYNQRLGLVNLAPESEFNLEEEATIKKIFSARHHIDDSLPEPEEHRYGVDKELYDLKAIFQGNMYNIRDQRSTAWTTVGGLEAAIQRLESRARSWPDMTGTNVVRPGRLKKHISYRLRGRGRTKTAYRRAAPFGSDNRPFNTSYEERVNLKMKLGLTEEDFQQNRANNPNGGSTPYNGTCNHNKPQETNIRCHPRKRAPYTTNNRPTSNNGGEPYHIKVDSPNIPNEVYVQLVMQRK